MASDLLCNLASLFFVLFGGQLFGVLFDGQQVANDELLRIPLIGVIPESEDVLQASNQGLPAVLLEKSDVAEAYKDVIDRFLGEDVPLRFTEAVKPGLLQRVFGRR